MKKTSGTKGYIQVKQQFIDATLAIDFKDLHRDFLAYLPKKAGRILDVGAGIGRDAFVFSQMGHSVTAIEPIQEFRETGQQLYDSPFIRWLDDALPQLDELDTSDTPFDFILASGVWHHLNPKEQHLALQRIAELLTPDGIFALTLRNGPAGAGTHVFPTDGKQIVKEAAHYGLATLLFLENQPSLMKNKEQVTWTKLVFQKQK